MKTRIIPTATRKVIENGTHHYVGKGVLTLDDGKEIQFAMKTRTGTKIPTEFQFLNDNGVWQPTTRLPKMLGVKFQRFLQLASPCFGNKFERNKAFFTDRLLQDATPANERPHYTALMTNFTCLIDGEFIYVRKQFVGMGFGRRMIETRQRLPLDMSSEDWEVFTPANEIDFSNKVAQVCAYYRSKITSYNRYAYHKDQVRAGARM